MAEDEPVDVVVHDSLISFRLRRLRLLGKVPQKAGQNGAENSEEIPSRSIKEVFINLDNVVFRICTIRVLFGIQRFKMLLREYAWQNEQPEGDQHCQTQRKRKGR